MKIIQWLIILFTREKTTMTDTAATPATDQVAAPEPEATAVTAVESEVQTPLAQAKAKFDEFVEFVEHGLKVLGKDAEADLVALKDKFR